MNWPFNLIKQRETFLCEPHTDNVSSAVIEAWEVDGGKTSCLLFNRGWEEGSQVIQVNRRDHLKPALCGCCLDFRGSTCWGWRHGDIYCHYSNRGVLLSSSTIFKHSCLSFELQSGPDFLSVSTASGERRWLLGLSKAAVKVQDHRRKAVNMRTRSWNTALPVPTATL